MVIQEELTQLERLDELAAASDLAYTDLGKLAAEVNKTARNHRGTERRRRRA